MDSSQQDQKLDGTCTIISPLALEIGKVRPQKSHRIRISIIIKRTPEESHTQWICQFRADGMFI